MYIEMWTPATTQLLFSTFFFFLLLFR